MNEPMSDVELAELMDELQLFNIRDALAEVRRLRGEVAILRHEEEFTKAYCGPDSDSLVMALRARLAQYESEGERDETPCCPTDGNVRFTRTQRADVLECWGMCEGTMHATTLIPRWRYLAAQRILEGK